MFGNYMELKENKNELLNCIDLSVSVDTPKKTERYEWGKSYRWLFITWQTR